MNQQSQLSKRDTSKVLFSREERKIFEQDYKRGLVQVYPDGQVKLHGFGDQHDITLPVDLLTGHLITDFEPIRLTDKALAFYREISETRRPKVLGETGQPAGSRMRR